MTWTLLSVATAGFTVTGTSFFALHGGIGKKVEYAAAHGGMQRK
jgi:hypothetical protein